MNYLSDEPRNRDRGENVIWKAVSNVSGKEESILYDLCTFHLVHCYYDSVCGCLIADRVNGL